MRQILITMLLILLLAPTTVLANVNTTLEERVAELEVRVQRLEMVPSDSVTLPSGSGFSGHGMTRTAPFTVTTTPFKISWQAQVDHTSGSVFMITVVYPEKGTTASSIGYYVEPGANSNQTWCYVESGTYYLDVNAESWVSWNVRVEN